MQIEKMGFVDKRMKLITEMINGIRIIKYYA